MSKNKTVSITGLSGARMAPMAADIVRDENKSALILTADYARAAALAQDLSFFVDLPVLLLPDEGDDTLIYDSKDMTQHFCKMGIIARISESKRAVVVGAVNDALRKLPPPEIYRAHILKIEKGGILDIDACNRSLVSMGYERFEMVEGKGQFAVRGDIIDIFPIDMEKPVRIELFGDEVESIRSFEADTQKSLRKLENVTIYPARASIWDGNPALRIEDIYRKEIEKADGERRTKLIERRDAAVERLETGTGIHYLNYLYDRLSDAGEYMGDCIYIVDEPDQTDNALRIREREIAADYEILAGKGMAIAYDMANFPTEQDYLNILGTETVYLFSQFIKKIKGVEKPTEARNVRSRQPLLMQGRLDMLESELHTYVEKGYDITICCSTPERERDMDEFLRIHGIHKVKVRTGELTGGIEYPDSKRVWISDRDIYSKRGRKKKRTRHNDAAGDIKAGDYVVHEAHGIGKYEGIVTKEIRGETGDYMKIKYAGADLLFVPVDQMGMITRYSGSDGAPPKLNKLNGSEWVRTKQRAEASIGAMLDDLVELMAKRQMAKGFAFARDNEWQKEFEDSFPYAETEDQLVCINEIKRDMEKERPMERLLCADVGFGKTEVAARAMFKCVSNGKQAMMLVPTTLLANQHYYTLKDRFEHFPLRVEVLSRFKSEKEQADIVKGINSGEVDLVIGTHRLLSSDVKFRDLGLMVIDEEQRFGVEHKAKIKKLKNDVDVLTLSATPIPRTLYMSLAGLSDVSVINEPPEDRYPVQTYVVEEDPETVSTVIRRELSRGGQVYVVTNTIKDIGRLVTSIREMVPEASVAAGHGRMSEKTLENVMGDFIAGNTDVLVATTIIESGLDISNVNSIIVLNADRFGLAQLYQLRGRVGRSDKMAYAYFMFNPGKVTNETAEKRLRAIREFTEFGSGYKIAMKDLEIRGAGNILGKEQSGHMINVGYELYSKMISKYVMKLKGEDVREPEDDATVDIRVPAFIPDDYVANEAIKLNLYKRIIDVHTPHDADDLIEEMGDRFGAVPLEVKNLVTVSLVRNLATEGGISRIYEAGKNYVFDFRKGELPPKESIAEVAAVMGKDVLFGTNERGFIKLAKDRAGLDKVAEALKHLVNR